MLNDFQFKKQWLSLSVQSKRSLNLHRKELCHSETEQGLTLIEGLLAMVIIAITVVSISPPIFWATATRVQTQRAEQALKIAQGEIDRVRSLVERNEVKAAQQPLLPPSIAGATESDVRNRTSGKFPAAPNAAKATVRSIRDCGSETNVDGTPNGTVGEFVQIDTNGDCQADYLLQTFRSQGLDQDGNQFQGNANQDLAAFVMGVRVYADIARPALTSGKGKTDPAALRATNGLGNQLDRPLAVMYSTIVRSSDSKNLTLYRQLCGTEANRTTGAC
jgi:type II secretory pathway pseudopilin PulG